MTITLICTTTLNRSMGHLDSIYSIGSSPSLTRQAAAPTPKNSFAVVNPKPLCTYCIPVSNHSLIPLDTVYSVGVRRLED